MSGPDALVVGEWMPQDVQWQSQPEWAEDARRVASTSALQFASDGRLRIAMGRFYLGDSIAFGSDPERRAYRGRWRWLDSVHAEIRYRLVHDDMPIRGEQIPGAMVIDTMVATRERLLDFDYARGAGGTWKDVLVRVPLLRSADRLRLWEIGNGKDRGDWKAEKTE